MKNVASFLMIQLARFGALTIPQMLLLCSGLCSRATLYRTLQKLAEYDLILRAAHPKKDLITYVATHELIKTVYGKNAPEIPELRIGDLCHTVAVAQTLIAASRFANVTGIATERELGEDEIKTFCFNRRPDGIIQISREGRSYELAVEVETSLKSEARAKDILDNYERTFDRAMLCAGTIIVAIPPAALTKYREHIEKKSEGFQRRVRIVASPELIELDPKVYGQRAITIETSVRNTLEKHRTQSHGQITYIPNYLIISNAADPDTSTVSNTDEESVRDVNLREDFSL